MNTFKKKALFAALTGLGVMGMVGSAQAVSLNPDGLGQALIYPYYTVRDGGDGYAFNSLISVVNSTNVGKAVKVRFLEGKASQEVLDFNLYLSPYDVWTAAIVPTTDGAGARIFTQDTSCTSPKIPAAGEPFRNLLFSGAKADLHDATVNRTKEGYAEIIEMADVVTGPGKLLEDITHINGVPKNCATAIDNGVTTPGWVNTDLVSGTGGLFGSMTLISPNEAQDVAYEAVALDAFFIGRGGPDHLWAATGTIYPNLASASPKTSTVIDGAEVFITSWPTTSGADAVSAVLMNQSVYNEYVLNGIADAKTDWVITFPTKWHYYEAPNADKVRPRKPGYSLFQRNFGANGACDDVVVQYFDREEASTTTAGDFSPKPDGEQNALCWEANVVTFGQVGTASVFHAENRVTLPVNYDSGWAKFTFDPTSTTGTGSGAQTLTRTGADTTQYVNLVGTPSVTGWDEITFTGLPMVGFAVQQFNNGEVASSAVPGGKVWASYAGRIAHRFSKDIAGPTP
jgi:hypothetical protein